MSKASCLCESVAWEITDEPTSACHCHCSLCRKQHGAAFATYYLMKPEHFRWIRQGDTIQKYRSSPNLERAFCGTCGTVVPQLDEFGSVHVPAGPHDDGPAIRSHIFAGSKAPWYTIADSLPQHDEFPGDGEPSTVPTPEARTESTGNPRGSCLCGTVAFEVVEPFKAVYHCHCSRCRKARAAAFTTNGFTSSSGVKFLKGFENVRRYKVPDAELFTHAFCGTCGSGMPRFDEERDFASVPLAALDDDPGQRPGQHIFVSDKADWFDIADSLPQWDQEPG